MAEDELLIHSGQLRLVDSLKKRVSQLFGVSVLLHPEGTRFFSDGGSASTRLLVSSVSGSQDDLEKAKKYLNAFFEEGPNFVKLSNIYSPESFAMVHERNSEIEKLTQVVLECQEESRCISMQGNEESIRAAKQIIEDLVKGKSQTLTSPAMWTHDIETDGGLCSPLQGGKFHLDSHNNNVVSLDGKLSPSSSCEALDACVRWQPRRESLHCEASLFPSGMDLGSGDGRINAIVDSRAWPSDAGDKLDCPGLDVDNGHYHSSPRTLSPSSSPSPPSPPSSSLQDSQKEVKEMRILQDQEHKVQKALKLGYSEEDAFMALERVGLDAGENDYLAELISLGSKSTNSMDSDRSPFLSGELELGAAFGVATSLSEKCELGDDGDNLRYIVIDGSNVAMSHGKKEVFSCRGIKLAVDWFRQRGHKQIKVFVPQWRKETSRPEAPITDQEILTQLEKEDVLVFTPARRIGSKRIVCYDDRYVLKLAAEVDGIVVSNDNYRDLLNASPDYRKVVEERLLMYSFVDDKFMPPDDPLGRKGPTLDNFLRIRPTVPEPLPPECPYGKKCTYGNKCRYYHPERGCLPHKSVTDKLAEQAKLKLQERSARLSEGLDKKGKKMKPKAPLTRTISCVPTQFMGNSASIVPSQGKEGISDADLLQRSQSLVEKRDYNEMLDEHRRKLNALERANAAEMKHFAPSRHMEFGQRSSTPIDPSRHSPTVLIQGPHPSAVPSQALDAQLLTPQMIPPPTLEKEGGVTCLPSPSRSPPSSQLLTPTSQASERKGFFGGHLMLAKKLSDESQDSKFFDDSDKNQTSKEGEGIPRSSSAGVIGYLATTTAAPVSMSQAAVSAETLHQAMAQMSFPTRQHPSPRHSAPPTQHHAPSLHSPYSMDSYYGQGERCISSPVGQGQSQMDSMYSMRGFQGDHCQSFPLIERGLSQHAVLALQQQKRQGFIDGSQQQRQAQLMARQPGFQGTLYDDGLYGSEHLGLARLQSAPSHLYQTNTQPPPRPITRMARQNSSSDPQIHTVGMEEATDLGLLSRGTVPYTSSESNMASLDLFESSPSHPPGSQAHPNLHHQQQQHQHQQQQHQHQHQQQHHQQQHPHHSPHHQPPPAYNRSSSFHHGNFVPQSHYLAMSHQSSYTVPAQQHSHHAWQDSTGRYSAPDPWAVGGGLLSPHSVTSPNSPHMPLSPQSVGRPRQVQQFNADAEILPSDPRYNLYFHLCGLFPPAKVRMVMNQHPNETNAQELCSYIIGLK